VHTLQLGAAVPGGLRLQRFLLRPNGSTVNPVSMRYSRAGVNQRCCHKRWMPVPRHDLRHIGALLSAPRMGCTQGQPVLCARCHVGLDGRAQYRPRTAADSGCMTPIRSRVLPSAVVVALGPCKDQ
jgi:hypothetical protein